MSIAEKVQAHDSTLNREQVKVCEPCFAEEDLRTVDIVVESDAQENEKDSDIDSVVLNRAIVVQDQKTSLLIILKATEVLGRLAVDLLRLFVLT